MKNDFKIFNINVLIFTFLVWIILNVSGIQDMSFYGGDFLITIIIKVLHLLFLYIIFAKIYSLWKNRHEPKIKNEIIFSLIYLCILMVLLICVWPGTWSSDDISVLINAQAYNLTPWQHFFSGLFQILCLQTIPIPTGVIIIQIVIASLIVGYCISNISTLFGESKKQIIIMEVVLLFITLLPPLVLYILSGFRMGIYSYLELLLITQMLILYKSASKATISDILKISFLTIIISCWRTEGIYYPILILILYLILGKKVISRKMAISLFLIVMVANISIGKINNILIVNSNDESGKTMHYNFYDNPKMTSNNYSISATMEPITQLIRACDKSDTEELEIINKVLDVDYILKNPENTGERNFWTVGVRNNYSKEEYIDYLKTYAKLALKYPDVTFKSMWNIFEKAGSGMGEDGKQTTRSMLSGGDTLKLFELSSRACLKWRSVHSEVEKIKQPINLELRNNVIRFFGGIDSEDNLTIIHNIFWNLFIPFTLILLCLIYKLIKKDWFMVFLIFVVIARIPLVFATAPAPYFMYYLSTYLCSYVISAITIFEFITELKNKKMRGLLCEKNY